MQKTTNKKDKDLNLFINWLNQNGAEFSDIYFQTYKKNERGVHTKHKVSSNKQVIKIPRKFKSTVQDKMSYEDFVCKNIFFNIK